VKLHGQYDTTDETISSFIGKSRSTMLMDDKSQPIFNTSAFER